jgi:predicted HAD superfamily Cof-like phosphohydrolase
MTIFNVARFQEKYGIPRNRKPAFLDDDNMQFRLNFLLEELLELANSVGFDLKTLPVGENTDFMFQVADKGVLDLEGAFDALLDLEFVLHGTAIMMGFNSPPPLGCGKRGTIWGEGQARVFEANMKKVRAVRKEDSKRGSTFDIIKPNGWEPPKFGDLLA